MNRSDFITPEVETDTLESLSEKLLHTTAQLMTANRQLEQFQKERSEMLSNISHDLRAPITAIRSALDLMTSRPDATVTELRDTLQLIDRRTATLENLIQDMYLLFTVENPTSQMQLETIEAAPFLEEYFFDISLQTLYEPHNLTLDMPETLSGHICIDPQKMLRVLDNLFTNAAKYSGDDTTITLRVRSLPEHEQLLIEVIDNGIGIPAEALSRIFDRTYTVSRARTPGSTAGSGLGLCIVRTIIERFGGEVCCESTLGKGCCFRILLPLI
ncbi:MAG: HAMP domain-containing histidine kinase [Lachnospiraceae bacterium]|nr:HAMP domain-containing histidine kinase [Lachnospiraceae bacterium]